MTPSLTALHAWRPDLRLCVLVEPAFAAALEGNPAVAEIILHSDFLSTVEKLRGHRFPVIFNHHGGPSSAFLTLAAGSPVRVCWERLRQFAWFYNVRVPDPARILGQDTVHSVEDRIATFYYAGLPRGPIPSMQVFPRPDAQQTVRQRLAEQGIAAGEPYVVVRPGAATLAKQWPAERFAELARWLADERKLNVVVDCGPGEGELAESIKPMLPRGVALLDSLGLRELIALVSGARLFVGNDTGPTHVAAAAGCRVAAIFSVTDPAIYGPWQAEHRVAQAPGLCPKCPGRPCYPSARNRCILSLDFDAVRAACEALL